MKRLKKKNPEKELPILEHIREFRNRIIASLLATSITSIICEVFSSSAGTPPTAVAPLNTTVSPVLPPWAVSVTITSAVEPSVAKQLSVSVVVYVARKGVML